MPHFDAKRIDTITYDFTTWRPPGADDDIGDWAGEVPEPSQDQVREFFSTLTDIRLAESEAQQDAYEQQDALDRQVWLDKHPEWVAEHPDTQPTTDQINQDLSAAQVRHNMAALNKVRQAVQEESRPRMLDMLCDFTDSHPPQHVLTNLPYRAMDNWIGFLAGSFSPEALAAASRLT